jgi:hypothetical protein
VHACMRAALPAPPPMPSQSCLAHDGNPSRPLTFTLALTLTLTRCNHTQHGSHTPPADVALTAHVLLAFDS